MQLWLSNEGGGRAKDPSDTSSWMTDVVSSFIVSNGLRVPGVTRLDRFRRGGECPQQCEPVSLASVRLSLRLKMG